MSFRPFLILGLTFLVSCEPHWKKFPPKLQEGDPSKAYVCIDVRDEIADATIRAVRTWDQSLGRHWKQLIPIRTPPNRGCSYVIQETEELNPKAPVALGWVSRIGGNWVYLRRSSPYPGATFGVVLHELGHALGAQHVEGTLMSQSYDPLTMSCPDKVTVAQVAAWNHINLETLSWCGP